LRKFCFGIGLSLLAFGLLLPTDATPQAPPKGPPAKASLDSDKLTPGEFTGTLVNTPDSERKFTVNVTYQKLQLKPGQNLGRSNQNLQQQYNRIVQLQNQVMHPNRRQNPAAAMQQLQNAIVQLQIQSAGAQANKFQVVKATQKVNFHASENLKVRIKDLPKQFDEKGKIKRYSQKELSERKGKDKSLPGFESSPEALRVGQVVQVTLRPIKKPKAALADRVEEKGKAKGKVKEKDPSERKLQVSLIVILKDGDTPQNSTTDPKKKN
jgi:hypothetical protein